MSMATELLSHDMTGQGPLTLLFVHGFPLDGRMWNPQAEAVASFGMRAIVPDLRGFGRSRAMPVEAGLDRHVEDLISLLDHHRVNRVVVVGCSMGGYIAFAMLRRHAHRVAALVLADTRAQPDSQQAKEGRLANIARAQTVGATAVFDAMVPKVFTDRTKPEVLEALRAIASEQPVDGLCAALETMRDRADASDLLTTITVPTWVVHGEGDGAVTAAESRAMAAAIPGAKLVMVEGVGHFVNVEAPERFNDVLRSVGATVDSSLHATSI